MRRLVEFFKKLFEPIPDPLEEKRRRGLEQLRKFINMSEDERNMMLLAHPGTGAVYTSDGHVLYKEDGVINKVTQSEYKKISGCSCGDDSDNNSRTGSGGSSGSGSVDSFHILD